MVKVVNKKWSDEEFLERRKQVLNMWVTGRDVDLDEAIAYHKQLPDEKVFTKCLEKANNNGDILVQVGFGHATVEETMEHVKAVQEAGVDLIFLIQDTYTRKCQYERAQQALDESIRTGHSLLNGFPSQLHGVKKTRQLIEAATVPIEVAGAADEEPMLIAEISFAAGCTATFNHDLEDLVLHSKNFPLDRRIENAQYIARLAAYYTERGAPIEVTVYALGHGFWPPSINIAIALINMLLTVEQGNRTIGLCLGLQGHLIQDVASLRAFKELAEEYLHRFGYQGVTLKLSCWPWMGDWPADPYQAAGFSSLFAIIPALAPVDWIYQKSLEEAFRATGPQGNVQAIKLTKQLLRTLKNQRLPDSDELELEKGMIKEEVRCILDRTIELGDGDPLKGEIKAVERGVIDVPFSAWVNVKDKVLPVRDATGAMRYLDIGNLPFNKEVIEYNRQKVLTREKQSHMKASIDMLINDIKYLSQPL